MEKYFLYKSADFGRKRCQNIGIFCVFIKDAPKTSDIKSVWIFIKVIEERSGWIMIRGDEMLSHLIALGPYFKDIFGKIWSCGSRTPTAFLRIIRGERFETSVSDGILAADDPMRPSRCRDDSRSKPICRQALQVSRLRKSTILYLMMKAMS